MDSKDSSRNPFILAWSSADTVATLTLAVVGASMRLWRLGQPALPIYDEVLVVDQARRYLHGGPYFVVQHPPLAKLLVALGILLVGDRPLGWRICNAIIGTLLIVITYFLARRMFRSRVTGVIAAALISIEGLTFVFARTGMMNIVYLTLIAAACLAFFRWRDAVSSAMRRRTAIETGLALGFCMGAKFGISAIAAFWLVGFAIWVEYSKPERGQDSDFTARPHKGFAINLILAGGVAMLAYVSVFIPYFVLDWWHGPSNLVKYNIWVLHSNLQTTAIHLFASRFWTWPLMLRCFPYWQDLHASDRVRIVWCGGNPALWWAGVIGMIIAIARAIRDQDFRWSFLGFGYVAFMAMWIPVRRYTLIYDYAPALYLSVTALAAVLVDCWYGRCRRWEQMILVTAPALTLAFALFGAFGPEVIAAFPLAIGAFVIIQAMTGRYCEPLAGKLACLLVAGAAIANFIYFFPVWTAMPITQSGLDARLWMHESWAARGILYQLAN